MKRLIHMTFALFLLLTCCNTPPQPPIVDVTPEKTVPLKDLNPRIVIGTPVDSAVYNNEKYSNIIASEFNVGQSLWYGNWGGWNGENDYDFANFNKTVNWMLARNMKPMAHMLTGQNLFMPDWLINGNWKRADLDMLLQNMIYSIMDVNDNKNKVEIWNVANELFEEDGSYRTNMVWTKLGWEADSSALEGEGKINTRHPVFIRKAFTYCREKTNKKLELRDYNIEGDNPNYPNDKKHKAFYQLVKHMLNTNIPIDAIGIQGHISVGTSSWLFENNALSNIVKKFKDLGLEVYITELDVAIGTRTWSDKLAEQQKEDYYNFVKQAITGGASQIYIWGIQDGADKGFLTKEHPLPWDENLNKKPAYYGIQKALMETK
jgi:GH35 family endo-1,4-beta-xylanase